MEDTLHVVHQALTLLLISLIILKILGFFLIRLFQTKNRKGNLVVNSKDKIDILVTAYNEEKVIVRTINNLLSIDYPDFGIIVINDGSSDNTLELLNMHFNNHPKIKILSQENKGKSLAANHGLMFSSAEIVTFIDADTHVSPNLLQTISNCFADKEISAMSGYLKVQNLRNMLTIGQNIEYATTMNLEREMFDKIDTFTIIPGAVCAFRKKNLLEIGGFKDETITEDCDVTFKLLKGNFRIINEKKAVAYTEAPDSLRMFIRQRIRWDYGLIQNLLKHTISKSEINNKVRLVILYFWTYRIAYTILFAIADYLLLILLMAGKQTHYYLYFLAIETALFLILYIREMDSVKPKTIFFLVYRILFRHLKFLALTLCIRKFIIREKLVWKKIKRAVQL